MVAVRSDGGKVAPVGVVLIGPITACASTQPPLAAYVGAAVDTTAIGAVHAAALTRVRRLLRVMLSPVPEGVSEWTISWAPR